MPGVPPAPNRGPEFGDPQQAVAGNLDDLESGPSPKESLVGRFPTVILRGSR